MSKVLPEFTYGDEIIALYGPSGTGKTTTQIALSINYQQSFNKTRRKLAKLFSQNLPTIQENYTFGKKWRTDQVAKQLNFIPQTNKEQYINFPEHEDIGFPIHPANPYHSFEGKKGYEATGIQLKKFKQHKKQIGMLEFGGLLLSQEQDYLSRFPGPESFEKRTKKWLKQGHKRMTETLEELPEKTYHVFLAEFNKITKNPLQEENFYVERMDKQLNLLKNKKPQNMPEIKPKVLVMKTDYASINMREVILNNNQETIKNAKPEQEWNTEYGLQLLKNCGYEQEKAERIQQNLLKEKPPEDSLKPLFNAVQNYFNQHSEHEFEIIGGGSIFRPHDYNVLVSSIIKIVNE